MITDLFIHVVKWLVELVVTMRPEWELHLPEEIGPMWQFLRGLDGIMPVTEVLTCLAAFGTYVAAVTGFKWLIKLIDWIADVIP